MHRQKCTLFYQCLETNAQILHESLCMHIHKSIARNAQHDQIELFLICFSYVFVNIIETSDPVINTILTLFLGK